MPEISLVRLLEYALKRVLLIKKIGREHKRTLPTKQYLQKLLPLLDFQTT